VKEEAASKYRLKALWSRIDESGYERAIMIDGV